MAQTRQGEIVELPLDVIDVNGAWNPRGKAGTDPYRREELSGLMAAIGEVGQLQPALVRPHPHNPGRYQLLLGWRRYYSRRLLGHDVLAVQVGDFRDDQLDLIATMENTQRKDLEQFETVRGVFRTLAAQLRVAVEDVPGLMNSVLNHGEDPHDLEAKLRMLSSQSLSTFATKYSRVLRVSSAEQAAVYVGQLSPTVALELVRLGERPERLHLLEEAIRDAWTARVAKQRVTTLLSPPKAQGTDLGLVAQRVMRFLKPQKLQALPDARAKEVEALLVKLEALLH